MSGVQEAGPISLRDSGELANPARMSTAPDAPETIYVDSSRVACDGASDIPGGAALGHPRVFIEIDAAVGYADCGYCDRRFVLKEGAVGGHH